MDGMFIESYSHFFLLLNKLSATPRPTGLIVSAIISVLAS